MVPALRLGDGQGDSICNRKDKPTPALVCAEVVIGQWLFAVSQKHKLGACGKNRERRKEPSAKQVTQGNS